MLVLRDYFIIRLSPKETNGKIAHRLLLSNDDDISIWESNWLQIFVTKCS